MPDTERTSAESCGNGPAGRGRAGAGGSVPSCMLCGTVAESAGAAALTWVLERDDRGRDGRLCPACARRHVRDIEAKLAPEWW